MPTPQSHRNLFQSSGASDKLNLLQTLLDAHTLNSDEALALLNAVHTELQQPQGHDPSVYVRYARMMEALRQQMPDVHQEVTTKWAQLHKKVTENYAAEIEPEKTIKGGTKQYEPPAQEAPKQQQTQRPIQRAATRAGDNEVEIRGGEEELEGPEPEEEEAKEAEEKEEKEEEVEKYGEEEEAEEAEEKEEKEKEEETEEEKEGAEGKEEETEEEEKEGAEEKEEKEEETEEEEKEEGEEKEEEKEEVEEKEEEEVEQEQEKEETETEVETAESEETDHRIAEAAEAVEEAEHAEVEVEPEEVESNPGEEEPPMESVG